MRKIKITIDSDGEVVIDAEGYTGYGCVDATKAIEAALALGKQTERKLKPEYHLTESTSAENRNTLTLEW